MTVESKTTDKSDYSKVILFEYYSTKDHALVISSGQRDQLKSGRTLKQQDTAMNNEAGSCLSV